MNTRQKIEARIKALRAMTVENGCTEAEAMLAFEKLQELKAAHNITYDADEVLNEGMKILHFKNANVLAFGVLYAINAAADVTHVAVEDEKAVMFFGTLPDVEYANYLFHIVNNCLGKAFNDYILTEDYYNFRKRGISEEHIRASFYGGLVDRLSARIMSLAGKYQPETSTGRELVIIKSNKIEDFMASLGIQTQSVSTELRRVAAVEAEGTKAGDKVALNDAVGGATKPNALLG